MRNKTLTSIIIATLLCALLVNAGRATRAYALALPAEPIQPVYETEVFALYEYVSNNLEQNVPQLDIFFLLSGALAVAQLGAQDALLESPYPNESSVKEWLINCGIQLYNAVIGLVPSGDYYINIPLVGQPESAVKGIPRSMIKALVAQMMGNAVVARNYSSVDDFLNDDAQHLMPFQRDLQVSINAIWQLQGGPYHWQFDTSPFTSDKTYKSTDIPALSNYWVLINQVPEPHVRANEQAPYMNVVSYQDFYRDYHYLFFNTLTNKVSIVNGAGQALAGGNKTFTEVFYFQGDSVKYNVSWNVVNNLNYDTSGTLLDAVHEVYNTPFFFGDLDFFLEDFITNVYAGTNWIDKQEIFNVGDLNISEDMNDYYRSPDEDVFIDIKDMIENLVNKTDIWDYLIDHLFDIDGNLILPNFPTFSVDLTPITELLAPPIPVDLNDIALYTDNDYLEEVKERSRKFGETIGEYFVFWHNSDPVLVYVIFGSFIVILVGAFIGKWGHS